jgi:phage shock protein PspC (stress-responsive transcriptional regulator)
MLGGVCAGLGEHLDIDPTVIRLVWVAVTLLSIGVGLVIYIIAWIIVPEGPPGSETVTVSQEPVQQN